MIRNCLLAGTGGQGTILLSRLIAGAALAKGLEVRGTETIGMAQRGGSVVSHIRMGEAASALIPPGTADLIIAFEVAEAVRALPFLAPEGRMLALDRVIQPASRLPAAYGALEMLRYLEQGLARRFTVFNAQELAARCGSRRTVNTVLLGAALAQRLLPFDPPDVQRLLEDRLPKAYLELNLKALELGLRLEP
ncbi:MAG: indolepyruvate oxidoreductase subunit beta [Treponema sp.]|jgi:indolepyruvate ferredoxin oxidoreductase beta subunit|nr:indolepyruvate oxidoreductase subunit beta [Treponema sp.]